MRRSAIVLVLVVLALAQRAGGQETTAPPSPTAQEAAQGEGQPDLGKVVAVTDLRKGDHVHLLMKTGQGFEGHVVAVEPATIVLDFTFSLQQLAGVVTFVRGDVAVVLRLPELTKEERTARLERRRQRTLEAQERWSITASADLKGRPDALAPTPEQEQERRRAEEREIERHRAVLDEFPPAEGWGPERLAQIRQRHFLLGMPVTYPEWRFWQLFDEWSEAKTAVELYEQSRKQEQQVLLLLFPPEEGWGPALKEQLEQKQQSEEELTRLEAQFLRDYQRWQEAAARKTEEQPPEQPTPTPAAPPAPSPAPPTP